MGRIEIISGDMDTYRKVMDQKLRPPMGVKINITYGESSSITILPEEIESFREYSEVDPISRRLPEDELEVTVLDPAGKYAFGDLGSRIPDFESLSSAVKVTLVCLQYDNEENTALSYRKRLWYIKSRPLRKNGKTILKCYGLFDVINDGMFYKCRPDTVSTKVSTFVDEINEDASRYTKIGAISLPPVIHENLGMKRVRERLPIMTHAEAIQTIANLFSMAIISENTNQYTMKTLSMGVSASTPTLKNYNILRNGISKSKTPLLGRCEVFWYDDFIATQNYEVVGSAKIFDRSTTTYHTEHSPILAPSHLDVSGFDVTNYRCASDVTRTPSSASGVASVDIEGKKIEEHSQSVSSLGATGGEENVIKNPLCTSYDQAVDLLRSQKNYLTARDILTIDYRGDPTISAGDTLMVEISKTEWVPALVLSSEIRYNGSLRGTLVVKAGAPHTI